MFPWYDILCLLLFITMRLNLSSLFKLISTNHNLIPIKSQLRNKKENQKNKEYNRNKICLK